MKRGPGREEQWLQPFPMLALLFKYVTSKKNPKQPIVFNDFLKLQKLII